MIPFAWLTSLLRPSPGGRLFRDCRLPRSELPLRHRLLCLSGGGFLLRAIFRTAARTASAAASLAYGQSKSRVFCPAHPTAVEAGTRRQLIVIAIIQP